MITEKVLKTVQENNMLSTGDMVLLGVSGGADSVCLLCVLKELFEGLDITVLHLHHGIRGAEADRDAEFVRELCKKHGAEFILVKRDIPAFAKERGLSEEEAGRIARYEEFEKAAKERGITKIAVAHNMNDAAETFIHNLCRGTGLAGLIGIAPVSGNIIRPLISVSRAEIEEYLKEKGESFVTDSTNLSGEYTRNRIRNTVIPELAGINPKAAEHIALAGANLYEIKDFMDKCVASELKRLKREKGEVLWNEEDFLACHPALKAEILLFVFKEVSFHCWIR